MKISGRVARQILLLSLLLMIVPAVMFPERLGSGLGGSSLLYVMYELVFYCIVIFLHDRRVSLSSMAKAAAICLVFRNLLSISFGLMIAGMYAMQLKVALMLGMFGYLPGLLMHIAMSPFVIRPLLTQLYDSTPVRRAVAPPKGESGGASIWISREKGFSGSQPIATKQVRSSSGGVAPVPASSSSDAGSVNGFDDVCRFMAQDTTVRLVAVVDAEGLLLSCQESPGLDAEDWSPFAVTMFDHMAGTLDRFDMPSPDMIDMTFKEHKLILARHESICLMVVANRQANDLLNIRASRGVEIIKKYLTERYGAPSSHNREKSYV